MLHPPWDEVPRVDSGVECRKIQQQQGQRSHGDKQALVASADRAQSWVMGEDCCCQCPEPRNSHQSFTKMIAILTF